MNCCDAHGNCNQGRDCPARAARLALRIKAELPTPTYPFAPGTIEGPQSSWRHDFVKSWPIFRELSFVLVLCLAFSAAGGLLAGIFSRCWA